MAFATSEWIKTQFDNFAARITAVFAKKEYVDNAISNVQTGALVFDAKADLDTWLESESNVSKLKVGQNIYIKATDTPDYWWDGTGLQVLETEKIDLDGYVTDTELSTTLAGYVKTTDAETENIDFSGYFS